MTSFVLASGSPRRRLLLSAAGYEFEVVTPEVDEAPLEGETATDMVIRLSGMKSHAVARDGTVVLGADTVVVVDGAVIGKPADRDEAIAILASLQGRAHSVLTGWSVRRGEEERFGVVESRVRFAKRSREELATYVDRTEPYDKAGAYALQGDNGWLVSEVIGSRANVMGLPLAEIVEALREFGVVRPA